MRATLDSVNSLDQDRPLIPAHKRYDKSDFFWLVYLIFFLIEPAARRSPVLWLETLAFIACFIVLYLLFLRSCNVRLRMALLGGMYLIGALAYPRNGGSTCFMIYAAALMPFVTPSVPWVLTGLLAESTLLAAQGAWLHFSPYSWFSGILLIITIGGGNIVFAQKQRADNKLRLQQEQIEALAAVAERERIARDLHDVLGHTLSVIVLKSELAARLLGRDLDLLAPPTSAAASAPLDATHLRRAQAEIADVERTARTALAEVREAIGGYRARGLRAEVDTARNTLASAGVTLHVEGDLKPPSLSAAEETVLALALREAVTNIVRHARASTCRLQLVVRNGHHHLSIQDDGQGTLAPEGNGLRGMRERVEALGGHLQLAHDRGTHLLIDLPERAS